MEVSGGSLVFGSWGSGVRLDNNNCRVIYGRKGSKEVKSGFGISYIRTLGWKHRVWFLACVFIVRNYSFSQRVSVGCVLGTNTFCLVLSKILWVQLWVELDLGLKSISLDLGQRSSPDFIFKIHGKIMKGNEILIYALDFVFHHVVFVPGHVAVIPFFPDVDTHIM